MMNAEIITIGDELLIGDTVNTNASWVGRFLTDHGFDVVRMVTIPDEMEIIQRAVRRALDASKLVIMTGGLGPTHDDITKKAVADLFGEKMVRHEPTLEHIRKFFERRGIPFSKSNYAQADVPESCEVLFNKRGTAPGMWFLREGRGLAVLPGVPHEMQNLMEKAVAPKMRELQGNGLFRSTTYLKTAGIGESTLSDEKIGDLSDFLGRKSSVAFLPGTLGVTIRVTGRGVSEEEARASMERVKSHIQSKAGEYYIGEGRDCSLAGVAGDLLRRKNQTLATAESCTGGLLASTVTDIPGCSDYYPGGLIAYSNRIKRDHLGVNEKDLDRFGAVSMPVALQMARGVADHFGADYGLSTTGIAGPSGGTEDKPVGTVWFGFWSEEAHFAFKTVLTKDRIINKERSVGIALDTLRRQLMGLETLPYGIQPRFA